MIVLSVHLPLFLIPQPPTMSLENAWGKYCVETFLLIQQKAKPCVLHFPLLHAKTIPLNCVPSFGGACVPYVCWRQNYVVYLNDAVLRRKNILLKKLFQRKFLGKFDFHRSWYLFPLLWLQKWTKNYWHKRYCVF